MRKDKRGTIKEAVIEEYFVRQVESHGGMCEKFVSPGKKGVPDRIVTWPAAQWASVHFVELKTIGGELFPWQERDHERRRRLGCFVHVIWTKSQVDAYVERYAIPPA